MKKSRFTYTLKQAEQDVPVSNIIREHNISQSTFYKCRSKYGGMSVSLITPLKELEADNAHLKKMYAEERLNSDILHYTMSKKWERTLGEKSLLKIPSKPEPSAYAYPI